MPNLDGYTYYFQLYKNIYVDRDTQKKMNRCLLLYIVDHSGIQQTEKRDKLNSRTSQMPLAILLYSHKEYIVLYMYWAFTLN